MPANESERAGGCPLVPVSHSAHEALCVVLGVGQETQYGHWVNESNGNDCSDGQISCTPANHFVSPSGRVLTILDGGPGWGVGIGLVAVCCAVILIHWLSQRLEWSIRLGERETRQADSN
jgi:hypothetical protein